MKFTFIFTLILHVLASYFGWKLNQYCFVLMAFQII